jgi:ABC-type nickel/cobalt efflux system permease component RcnA
MSVTAQTAAPPFARRSPVLARLAVATAAVMIVAAGAALLAWLLASAAPPVPARNPFGMGVREAAPSATGLGGVILAMQASFFKSLQAAVADLKQSGAALWTLIALGFAYGVFHAAGPGHGKAVIAAYLVSSERALVKGFALSLGAALVQAVGAVVLVSLVTVLLRGTVRTMSQVTSIVEITSFAAVAALGLVLVWRKAGKLLAATSQAHAHHAHGHAHHEHHHHAHSRHDHVCDDACGHVHLTAREVDRLTNWRDMVAVVFAAGIRPCAGALVVLVFALSQGLFAAGIAATFAMALGTALTTGLIATLAVFAKSVALRFAAKQSRYGSLAIPAVELLAAAFVLVLGASLLAGLWAGVGAS